MTQKMLDNDTPCNLTITNPETTAGVSSPVSPTPSSQSLHASFLSWISGRGSTSGQNSSKNYSAIFCRICHEGESAGEKLLSPCSCSGSVGLLHRSCLEKWLSTANNDTCEICHKKYSISRHPRPFRSWLFEPVVGDDQRNLVGDGICFLLLTPLAAISAYLCFSGAIFYLKEKKSEAIGLICLSTLLVIIYMAWLLLTIRYHCQVWFKWRSHNQDIRLLDVSGQRTPLSPIGTSGSVQRTPLSPIGRLVSEQAGEDQIGIMAEVFEDVETIATSEEQVMPCTNIKSKSSISSVSGIHQPDLDVKYPSGHDNSHQSGHDLATYQPEDFCTVIATSAVTDQRKEPSSPTHSTSVNEGKKVTEDNGNEKSSSSLTRTDLNQGQSDLGHHLLEIVTTW